MQMCCLFVGYDLHPLLRLASGDLKSWQRTLGREHNYVELIHGSNMVLVMWLLQVYWPILLAYFILLLAPCLQHVVTECSWNECLSWHECLEFPTEMPTFFLIPSGQLRFWQWRTGWSIWSNTSQELEHPWTALLPASSHRTCNRSVVANFSQVCTLQLWEADLWRAVKSQGDSWHFFLWQQVDGKLCATKCAGARREERQMMEVDRRGWVLADVLKGIRQQKIWFTLARIARSARLMRLFST